MNDKQILNFSKALNKLKNFCSIKVENERDMAGIIQAFEYTFEQAWKTFQKVSQTQGLIARSPKESIEAAFQLGLIDISEEECWLQMLEDRNLTSHTYNEETAKKIFEKIINSYLNALSQAFSRFK